MKTRARKGSKYERLIYVYQEVKRETDLVSLRRKRFVADGIIVVGWMMYYGGTCTSTVRVRTYMTYTCR